MKKSDNIEELQYNSHSFQSTVSSKGQVTIPAKIREFISADPGDKEFYVNENNEVIVKTIKRKDILSLLGSMPPKREVSGLTWEEIRRFGREEILEKNHKS